MLASALSSHGKRLKSKSKERRCCGVCFDPVSATILARLSCCSHVICDGCLDEWVVTCVENGPSVIVPSVQPSSYHHPSCPACKAPIPDAEIESALHSGSKSQRSPANLVALSNKWQRLCSQRVVVGVTDFIACCNPECGGGGFKSPMCFRAFKSACPHCGTLIHKRVEEENATMAYIRKQTKSCPYCHVRIERSDGCNHMVCFNCRNGFCWACAKPWHVGMCLYVQILYGVAIAAAFIFLCIGRTMRHGWIIDYLFLSLLLEVALVVVACLVNELVRSLSCYIWRKRYRIDDRFPVVIYSALTFSWLTFHVTIHLMDRVSFPVHISAFGLLVHTLSCLWSFIVYLPNSTVDLYRDWN